MPIIKGDLDSFNKITKEFADAAHSYQESYKKLSDMINDMGESEDFAGLPGKLLIDKYKEKHEIFDELNKILGQCTDKMDKETQSFKGLLANLVDDVFH